MYEIIIDLMSILLLIINLCVLVFIGGFLVKLRDSQKEFMTDLLDAIGTFQPTKRLGVEAKGEKKTWDQKFEEEMEDSQRRRMQDPGLVDPDKK